MPVYSLADYTLRNLFGHGLAGVIINSLLICLTLALVLGFVYVIISDILDYRRLLRCKTVCLEITPPAFTDKTPLATEQLFNILHGLRSTRTWREWLVRHKIVLSLEVVSTKTEGIRYVARVPVDQIETFKQDIVAYLPDSRFKVVEDYFQSTATAQYKSILDFKLTHHFAYPLSGHNALYQHDPIAYLTNAMTKLEDNELIALQVVLSPASPRSAARVRNKLLSGKEPGINRSQLWVWPFRLMLFTAKIAMVILKVTLETISEAITSSYNDKPTTYRYSPPSPAPTLAAQAVLDTINDKLSQPLFRVSLRALVVTDNKQHRIERVKGIVSSLATYHVPGYQGLTTRTSFPNKLKYPYRLWQYKYRMPTLMVKLSCILSASELAGVYHFPHSSSARTENVVKSLSRSLPAPLSLKAGTKFDVILGKNVHQGQSTPIGLTEKERERHVYIIGGTGNGKTTMLLYAMVQDIKNGKGLAVIDPHGDLAETVLKYIPESRVKDVIYFNPDDIKRPIGLNLLELPSGLDEDELIREKDLITETVISVFRKIFSDDDSGGHRIEYVLRNAIQTALTIEGATIFTIFRLLTDAPYRKQVAKGLENSDLKNFWANELGKAGEFQRVKMSAGVTSKIGRFLFSASARRILEQPKSSIDFDEILSSGKILICNFSKGLLGEDTSSLFGITTLAKLQIATLRRARLSQTKRTPFYLYADEFQNFATMSFVQLLSEARKYKLFLLMAEQSTSQQKEQRLVKIVLANVGTVVCFRSGNPDDEKLMLPLFRPFINEGEIAYLPPYNFYVRIAAVNSQEPLSGETLLLDNPGSQKIAQTVIQTSRNKYGKTVNNKADRQDTELLTKELNEDIALPTVEKV